MKIRNFIFILMVFSIAFSLQMTEPLSKEVYSEEIIYLGSMGPGQTMHMEFDPWIYDSNDEYVAHYDLAKAGELPEGWKSTQSKLYGDPLQITVSSAEFEEEGTYDVIIQILDEDNAEEVENIEFIGKIKIIHDVMDVSVEPQEITTGAGQPARFYITITNKGLGSDVFEVSSENVPKWSFKKHIYVPPQGSKTIVYEIVENEEEVFFPVIKVKSTSSSIIQKEQMISLEVNTDLLNDFKATNHGTPIFPILEEPIFALMGLLSNLW